MATRTPATSVTPDETAAGFYVDATGAVVALVGISSLRARKMINDSSGAVEYVIDDARGDAALIMESVEQLRAFFPRR